MAFIKKNMLWLVLGLLVLGGGGFALYHFVFKKKTDAPTKKEADTPAVEPLATVPGTPKKEDPRLKDMIAGMQTPDWIATLTAKAKANNTTVAEQTRNDAQWMLDEQDGKHKK